MLAAMLVANLLSMAIKGSGRVREVICAKKEFKSTNLFIVKRKSREARFALGEVVQRSEARPHISDRVRIRKAIGRDMIFIGLWETLSAQGLFNK